MQWIESLLSVLLDLSFQLLFSEVNTISETQFYWLYLDKLKKNHLFLWKIVYVPIYFYSAYKTHSCKRPQSIQGIIILIRLELTCHLCLRDSLVQIDLLVVTLPCPFSSLFLPPTFCTSEWNNVHVLMCKPMGKWK